jgi:hypothetical protein
MEFKIYETKNNVELLISEPFQPFETDCDNCKHFYSFPLKYPGGDCMLHGFSCGYGFTCKDFEKR